MSEQTKAWAWIVAWSLFWTGHIVSQPLRWDAFHWLYPLYNWLMLKSSEVQDKAGLAGPWKPITPTKETL